MGVLLLLTWIHCFNFHAAWESKVLASSSSLMILAKLVLTETRFDDVWNFVCFSRKCEICPALMSHLQYHYLEVDNFVENFLSHQTRNYSSSNLFCVDESISCSYELGEYWINKVFQCMLQLIGSKNGMWSSELTWYLVKNNVASKNSQG